MKLKELLVAMVAFSSAIIGCMPTTFCNVCDAANDWMIEDSIITSRLGEELRNVLFYPDSVFCYYINSKKDLDWQKDTVVLEGYVRGELIDTLNVSKTAVLQFLLLSNVKNYEMDSIKVQSPYMPHLEFAMHKDTTEVSVVVSNLDQSWQIVKGGKLQSSGNYVDSKANERFCNYFIEKNKSGKK